MMTEQEIFAFVFEENLQTLLKCYAELLERQNNFQGSDDPRLSAFLRGVAMGIDRGQKIEFERWQRIIEGN